MIEYTIKVNNINQQTSKMVITAIPQVANTEYDGVVSPISTKIEMTPERLSQIVSQISYNSNNEVESVSGALVELRKEVIKYNSVFQNKWSKEIETKSVSIPKELEDWLGHEFPVVTQAEVQSYANTS